MVRTAASQSHRSTPYLLPSFPSSPPSPLPFPRLPMEKRPPPSPLSPMSSSSPPLSSQHYAHHKHWPSTYVVQVPKDQIYRVPHPEHAGIVRRSKHCPLSSSCCHRDHCFLFLLVFLFVFVCVAIFVALRPCLPQFSVTHANIYNRSEHSPSRPTYEFAMKARNANLLLSVAYSKGGNASLIQLRTHKTIAAGQISGFDQVPAESTPIRITLEGRDQLPDELQKEGASAMLLLSAYLPIKMRIGQLSTSDMDFYVACEIRVTRTTSSEATQIDSQTCKSSINGNL